MRTIGILTAFAVFGLVSCVAASDVPEIKQEQSEEQKLEEKVKAMGSEMSRVVIEGLKTFLDQELKALDKKKGEDRDAAQKQMAAYEDAVKKNPKDPGAHLALGKIYDDLADGANAIIHTKNAEELFVAKKDVKGTAESRRNLRNYYEKYGFKPEDFNVSK